MRAPTHIRIQTDYELRSTNPRICTNKNECVCDSGLWISPCHIYISQHAIVMRHKDTYINTYASEYASTVLLASLKRFPQTQHRL